MTEPTTGRDWHAVIVGVLSEDIVGGETDSGVAVWWAESPETMATHLVDALGLHDRPTTPHGECCTLAERAADEQIAMLVAENQKVSAHLAKALRRAKRWAAKVDEARMWARHGYEIGQRSCTWADHGVAPEWLTEDHDPAALRGEHTTPPATVDPADLRATIVRSLRWGLVPLAEGRMKGHLPTEFDIADHLAEALTAAGWPHTYQPGNPHVTAAREARAEVDRLTGQLAQVTRERDDRGRVLKDVIAQREDAYRARDEARRERDRESDRWRSEAEAHHDLRERIETLAIEVEHVAGEWAAPGQLAWLQRCWTENRVRALLDGPTPAPNTAQPTAEVERLRGMLRAAQRDAAQHKAAAARLAEANAELAQQAATAGRERDDALDARSDLARQFSHVTNQRDADRFAMGCVRKYLALPETADLDAIRETVEALRRERERADQLARELADVKGQRILSVVFGHHKGAPRPFALYRSPGRVLVALGAEFPDGAVALRLADNGGWTTRSEGGAYQFAHEVVWLSDEIEALAVQEKREEALRAGIQALIDRKRFCGADDLRALLADGPTPAPNTTQPETVTGGCCNCAEWERFDWDRSVDDDDLCDCSEGLCAGFDGCRDETEDGHA